MKLKDFELPISTAMAELRGRSVVLHLVSAAQSLAIIGVFPEPAAPLHKNPQLGSLADPEPNYQDPTFKTAFSAARRKREAATVAISMRLEVGTLGAAPSLEDAGFREWCTAAANAVQETLSLEEVFALCEKIRGITTSTDPVVPAA